MNDFFFAAKGPLYMKETVHNMLHDEDGAVTVDFVVLVAAICTLGLIVVQIITGGVEGVSNDIVEFLNNQVAE